MKFFVAMLFATLCGVAHAQERRSVDAVVAAEIGQCVLQRSALLVENADLRTRVAALEQQLAESKAAPANQGK